MVTFGDWDGVWVDGQDVDSEGLWKLSSGEVLPKGLHWAPGKEFMTFKDQLMD